MLLLLRLPAQHLVPAAAGCAVKARRSDLAGRMDLRMVAHAFTLLWNTADMFALLRSSQTTRCGDLMTLGCRVGTGRMAAFAIRRLAFCYHWCWNGGMRGDLLRVARAGEHAA